MSDWPAAVRRAATVLDRWQWLVLLLASPFFLFPAPARTPLLLALPLVWLAAGLAGQPPLPRTPLNGALLLFSLMLLVSLAVAPDLAFSLPKIAGVLLGLGAYFAIVRLARTPAALWRAVALFLLSGGGLVLLGLVGIDWLDKLPLISAITSRLPVLIRGLPGAEEGFSANGVSGALIFMLPLQVALLAATLRNWPRLPQGAPLANPASGWRADPASGWRAARARLWLAAQVLLLVMTGGLLVLGQSRGAWLGFAAALALMLAWSDRRARWLLLAAAGLAVVGMFAIGGPQAALNLLGRVIGSDVDAKVIQRQMLWHYGLLIIRDFPFTGMGLNTFRQALPWLYPLVPLPIGYDIVHAHNHLLQAAINFGLPGLVAYLGLWVGAGYALVAAYRASRDPWLRALALGLAAGLAAQFVYGTTDVIDFGAKLGLYFWFTLALSVAVYQVTHSA